MIGNGALVNILYAVRHATGVRQFLYQLFDALRALGNLLDELHVTGRQTLGLFGTENVLHALHILDELALVVCRHRNDVVHGEVAQHTGLNLYGLDIHLPFHLVASFQFLAVHDFGALKHLDTGLVQIVFEDDRARLLHVQSAACSLLDPLVAIAVAVEADRLARPDVVLQHFQNGRHLGDAVVHLGIDTLLERVQHFGHSGIECYHG